MADNAELLKRAGTGDGEAEAELVEKNMGLVYSIVRRFSNRGGEAEDLVQIGAIGLIKAVKKFDLSFGVKLSTYAVPMIIGEIKRFLRDDGAIKVSRAVKENAVRARRAEEELRLRLGRDPTLREIAIESGMDEWEITEAFDASLPPESLQAGTENEDPLINRLSSDDTEDKIVDKVFLRDALDKLSEREYEIIFLRYFRGKTQTEVAERIGVSQVQISRIEKKALLKLRNEVQK